ncbi:MAG: hypothetical protein LBU32_06500 [Clostridiales bacterium]|nr:hypothetical protein [Clostridiales bacterium]
MKDSIQIGETYIIIANKISDESAIFTQSSLHSIVSPKDTDAIAKINGAIND